jgi:hypothetical protein
MEDLVSKRMEEREVRVKLSERERSRESEISKSWEELEMVKLWVEFKVLFAYRISVSSFVELDVAMNRVSLKRRLYASS